MSTHLINGHWLAGSGEERQSRDYSDSEILWRGKLALEAEVNAAIAAARDAFPSWSAMPLESRIEILRSYQTQLHEQLRPFSELISSETGKPEWESAAEVNSMAAKIEVSIAAQAERAGSKADESGVIATQLRHRPHGVLAVLGPFNFPGHLPNGHIVPALLAGNTLVFKPSEETPAVGAELVRLLLKAGLPDGVLNLIQGNGQAGRWLAAHPDLDGLLFTGSSRTGRAIHRKFSGQPGKLLALEMGGNNPLLVHTPFDIRAAVFLSLQSSFLTAGQRCTCARRLILVQSDQSEEFLRKLLEAARALDVGLPNSAKAVFMGPLISERAAEQVLTAQEELLSSGASSLLKTRRLQGQAALLSPGIIDVTACRHRRDEEIFGPLLQLIRVDTLEQAIAEANNTRFGLSAGIITEDEAAWQRFYQCSRAGIINRNRPLTGASSAAPFGGTGDSGNLRPSAYYAADYCAYPVASMTQAAAVLPEDTGPGIHV